MRIKGLQVTANRLVQSFMVAFWRRDSATPRYRSARLSAAERATRQGWSEGSERMR